MQRLPVAVWCIFKSSQACVCAHVKGHKSFCHKSVSILHLLSMEAERRNEHLNRVGLILPLISLLGKVRCNIACLSISICRTNYSCTAPPLFWCSRSCLLSGRWQRAKEVIASLELAPSENTATAAAIDWRTSRSVAADAARVPPFSPHCVSATVCLPSCWEESSSLNLGLVVKKPGGKHLLFA